MGLSCAQVEPNTHCPLRSASRPHSHPSYSVTLNTDHHLHLPLALEIVSEDMSDQAVAVLDSLATPSCLVIPQNPNAVPESHQALANLAGLLQSPSVAHYKLVVLLILTPRSKYKKE